MVEEEERSGTRSDCGDSKLVGLPYERDEAHAEAEERYDGTTGEGVEQDVLSTCGERQTEGEVGFREMTIMGLERERRFRARLPETLDIGEANPTGACTVEEKIGTANEIEESAARDESTEGEVMISFLTPWHFLYMSGGFVDKW